MARLTPEELEMLRSEVNAKTTEQLEEDALHDWLHADAVQASVDDATLARIYANVKRRISEQEAKPRAIRLTTVWRWAAAIVLPLMIVIGSFYFYNDRQTLAYATGQSDSMRVVLPDNSVLTLSPNTTVTLNKRSFAKDTRSIKFDGRAYFSIAKDARHPFIVNTKDVEVKVLGTKFMLSSASRDNLSRLTLDEGKVAFAPKAAAKQYVLYPNQGITFNRTTHDIHIYNVQTGNSDNADTLVFNHTPLQDVIARLQKKHNCHIALSAQTEQLDDPFTGNLSGKDLTTSLQIICNAYDLKIKTDKNSDIITLY